MQPLFNHPKWLTALAAVVASIAGIGNDFVYDDRAMLVVVTRLQGLGQWREILSQSYWPPPFYDLLYRPAASLMLAAEYAIGSGSPMVFRMVSIILYAASAALFYSLASRLVSPRAALAAALLWAVHPVHVEAVAQAVNQSEIVVTIAALAMAILYLDSRRAGAIPARTWALLVGLFALSTLVKETGFILPALLLLIEWVLLPGEPLRARAANLWRGYAAFGLVAVVVLMVRGQVLAGAVLTANPSAALNGASLGGRLFAMLQVVPMWLRLLVWPLRLQVDFAPSELGMPARFGSRELAGVVLLVATIALIFAERRRLRVLSFGLAWCLIGLLPVSNIVPIHFMLAERTLFLPSVGFFVAVAGVGQWAAARARWPRFTTGLVAACGVLCVLGVIRSTSRHLVWNTAHLQVKSH